MKTLILIVAALITLTACASEQPLTYTSYKDTVQTDKPMLKEAGVGIKTAQEATHLEMRNGVMWLSK